CFTSVCMASSRSDWLSKRTSIFLSIVMAGQKREARLRPKMSRPSTSFFSRRRGGSFIAICEHAGAWSMLPSVAKDVDARDKPGHDEKQKNAAARFPFCAEPEWLPPSRPCLFGAAQLRSGAAARRKIPVAHRRHRRGALPAGI